MKKILISFIVSLYTLSGFAAQKYLINDEEVLKVVLSKTRINRISIKDDKIDKVIGNVNEFHHETDNGNVYLLPHGEPGSHFELSLSLDSGATQTLRCKVASTDEGQIIVLAHNDKTYNDNIQRRALSLIKELALIHDHKAVTFNDFSIGVPVKVVASQKIDFDDLQGFKILLINDSSKNIPLKERDLVINGYKTIAVSLEENILKPNQQALLFAVAIKR
jgi:hypothetical protein